jgi:hypothetical protein
VVSYTPWTLYSQGKSPWYPLDRRLGGPKSRFGNGGEDKNSQPLPGLEPPIIQSVAQRYTTELFRFLIANISFENVAKFNSLEATVTNQNCIQEEIRGMPSATRFKIFHLPITSLKTVVLYGCET